jgi:hypothetical protein
LSKLVESSLLFTPFYLKGILPQSVYSFIKPQ